MKPRVSREEFKEVLSNLAGRGWSQFDLNRVKMVFLGDLEESAEWEQGIDVQEIAARLKWLREHKSQHGLSEDKIEALEQKLKNKL